jgi:hypothetical protein
MKKLLSIISLVALIGPAVALADEPGATAQSAQAGSRPAMFEQVHQKMQQIHTQARSQILAALTPAHKAALANIVGQLAIAPNPDVDAAARQLDSLLSTGEKQAVVRIHNEARTQMHSVMQAVHQQMAASMPPGEHALQIKEHSETAAAAPDAGHILLHLAMPHEGMMMMHHPD